MRSLPAKSFFVATLALTVGLAGCSSGGASSNESGARRGSSTRLTQAELEPVAQLNLQETIRQLRPNWLRARAGQEPAVIIDGSPAMGGLNVLRSYQTADIQMLEYMSSSDATNRFGTGYQGGAILVTTRRR